MMSKILTALIIAGIAVAGIGPLVALASAGPDLGVPPLPFFSPDSDLEETGDLSTEGDQGPPEAVEAFHEARRECLDAFREARQTFRDERRALIEQIREVARSGAEDKDEQISELESQLEELEEAKDAAEEEKDACIEDAAAAKDEALEEEADDENGEGVPPEHACGYYQIRPNAGHRSGKHPPGPPFDLEAGNPCARFNREGAERPGGGPPDWAGGPPPWAGGAGNTGDGDG